MHRPQTTSAPDPRARPQPRPATAIAPPAAEVPAALREGHTAQGVAWTLHGQSYRLQRRGR